MQLTADDHSAFEGRSDTIDYDAPGVLYYLGQYERRLPVNLARMIENAYDWEHLPYVHPNTFSDIALVASGPWGWRAKVETPPHGSGQYQLIELLVDASRHYWATTVVEGAGQGTQIHTQASDAGAGEIEIDVRFYLPEPLDDDETSKIVLEYLQGQYGGLYDEDEALMQGRQAALERRAQQGTARGIVGEISLGAPGELGDDLPLLMETPRGRICVNYWQGSWVVYGADCPHQLGPLEDSEVDASGYVTCPWHGYRFHVVSGACLEHEGCQLAQPYQAVEREGELVLRPTPVP